ncbi:tyrosine-type recombinase/integrase [Quadrisphaera sp. INWT6]|uniref:tyrosine-type recombinase/integrase n=1 Tax=Quadrisphaera sp. INWT6 TaxID=2596917 RepID=UPI001891FC40|nr:tyrosine-type recombinase/integrase [Quadrisphaera sp. INWT6]MBF5081495.1 tyrosine-type recombinase/integrase [Quadrisphaera sp. INWT6]
MVADRAHLHPTHLLGEAINDFANFLLSFERLRPTTVHNYVTYAHRILTHLPPDAIAGEISPVQLRGWLNHEDARGLSASSQQLQWYALHAYYRWLSTLGFTGRSPLDHVRPPRALPVARQDYTADEAEAITEAARATAQDGNRREQFDYAVLSTLRYTGIRRTELTTLRLSDLEIERTRLSVLGKGNKLRTVPLPPVYVEVMTWYLTEVRRYLPESDRLFANPRSLLQGPHRGATNGKTLERVVQRYGEMAGVAGPHLPHRWRHTYATYLLRRGLGISHIQKLLGHASMTTTSIYLHLVQDDLQEGVTRAFG